MPPVGLTKGVYGPICNLLRCRYQKKAAIIALQFRVG